MLNSSKKEKKRKKGFKLISARLKVIFMKISQNIITKACLFKFTERLKKFQRKKSDIFYISAQNIDCGYPLELPQQGGSNAFPQSMFLSRNKKNNIYPCKPQMYYKKVGFKGVKVI